jgi:FkbM family methyltransferase
VTSGPPLAIRLARRLIPRLPLGRYRASRALSRVPFSPFYAAMPAPEDGLVFECDLRDVIARDVCLAGVYEPQETLVVRSTLGPGLTFVDVGANWGYFTLLAAALVGPTGHVVGIEPDPRLLLRLRRNVDANRLTWVRVLDVAVAEAEATVSLRGYSARSENFGVSRVVAGALAGPDVFQVRARALDDVLRGFERVDLVKIDVEGGEAGALAGMRRLLAARVVRRLLLELHPAELAELGRSVHDVYGPLADAGYRGFTIDHAPATTRRAAYGRPGDVAALLRPLEPGRALDAWPHQLWLAPGVMPPC